ncbi:MAG: hypothetical protein WA660_14600 [Candidatus Acidiferrales bacterium]
MRGVIAEAIPELDEVSEGVRRMYFVRNLLRTQTDLSGAVQTLLNCAEFKELLEKQSDDIKVLFKDIAAKIGKAHLVLKDVRNDVCGHVKQDAVQAALERINWQAFGMWDVGPRVGSTHYKFASELVAEMLLKDVSPEERATIQSSKFEMIVDGMSGFELIDYFVMIYAMDRGLLPRRALR